MKVKNDNQIFWTRFKMEAWSFYIAATKNGLCYVSSQNGTLEELEKWRNKQLPDYLLIENDHELEQYKLALSNYFSGDSTVFTIPTDVYGTDFQKEVWHELTSIPYGQTVSYSVIAEAIGKDKAVRAVATSIGANPILIIMPCHRVIGKNGKLTGYRGGLKMKERLLNHEGWFK